MSNLDFTPISVPQPPPYPCHHLQHYNKSSLSPILSDRFPALELDNDLEGGLENEMTQLFGPNAGFRWKDNQGNLIRLFTMRASISAPEYLAIILMMPL